MEGGRLGIFTDRKMEEEKERRVGRSMKQGGLRGEGGEGKGKSEVKRRRRW